MEKLEAKGLRDDTIIIFMSDNGHSTEHNRGIHVKDSASGYPKGHYYSAHGGGGYTGKWIGNKGTFLEGGVRVPAIISYPKELPQNVVRDQAVTVMDWFPTILELAGISRPDVVLDGRSMLPVIKDASAPSAHPVLYFQWKNDWAVRQGDWKLITRKRRSKAVTLHNLSDENPEKQNHAAEHPEIVERLQKLYEQWHKEVTSK